MPPTPLVLSANQARSLALRAQGLAGAPAFGEGREGVLRAIVHLGYVQLDTIAVVERAHHHVLWTRVPGYRGAWLDECMKRREVFEYWAHAAAILPMRDYRLALPTMRAIRKRGSHWHAPSADLKRVMGEVRREIRARGPLALRDLEATVVPVAHPWVGGKLEKPALHELWMRGEVMVAGRRGFEKIHDLPERVLPPGLDRRAPPAAEWGEALVRGQLRALGLARPKDLWHQAHAEKASAVKTAVEHLCRNGEVIRLRVDGVDGDWLARADADFSGEAAPEDSIRILSPFDNLIIHRDRCEALFGFRYRLECYVPEAKRQLGYFCLPLLRGARFVGVIDAKADRKAKVLRVQREHLTDRSHSTRAALRRALDGFAEFNGCSGWRGPA